MALAILAILLGIVSGQKKGPCDETRECRRYTFSGNDRMLCFGLYGCKGANMDSTATALCSGANACTRATFNTLNEKIACNGFKSCQRGRSMTNNNKISCNGLKACVDVIGGLNAPKIYCDGDIACSNFKSKTNSALMLNLNAEGGATPDDNLLYCNGNQVCRDTQQRSDGMIYCDGDGACKESRQQAKDIQCLGMRSCKDSIIQPLVTEDVVDSLLCHGWFGCSGTNVIMVENINAYGFNAMANAVIETRGEPFNLKAFGFRAMAGASIDCKGSECTIECRGNACKGLPIAVARSSTLNLTPAACDPNNAGCEPSKNDPSVCKKVAGTHCPIINRASGPPNDDEEEAMTAWLQSKVNEWKQTEEYQEYLEMEDIAEQESSLYIEEKLRDYEMLDYDVDEDDELFIQKEGESYLFGGNVSLQTQIASSLITSNLLTAIAVFLLTGGVIRVIFNKYRGDYKSIH